MPELTRKLYLDAKALETENPSDDDSAKSGSDVRDKLSPDSRLENSASDIESTNEYTSDGSLADFIVSDSASEAELRKGSPKRQPQQKTRPLRRRLIIESDSSADEDESLPTLRVLELIDSGTNKRSSEYQGKAHQASPRQSTVSSLEHDISSLQMYVTDHAFSDDVESDPGNSTKHREPLSTPKICSFSKSPYPMGPPKESDSLDIEKNWEEALNLKDCEVMSFPLDVFQDLSLASQDATTSHLEQPTSRISMYTCPTTVEGKRAKEDIQIEGLLKDPVQSAKDLLVAFDSAVCNGQLQSKLKDGFQIDWSKRMTKSAGLTKIKFSKPPNFGLGEVKPTQYSATVVLAARVLTSDERLLNTVAHEFCHIVSNVLDGENGHGPRFKYWARKLESAFDVLQPIARCHNYKIEFKYAWQCPGCYAIVEHHTSSWGKKAKICKRCNMLVEQIRPPPKMEVKKDLTPYQKFVKDNYNKVQQEFERDGLATKRNAIFTELGRQWAHLKEAQQSRATSLSIESLSIESQ